jgi:hypothetical protein
VQFSPRVFFVFTNLVLCENQQAKSSIIKNYFLFKILLPIFAMKSTDTMPSTTPTTTMNILQERRRLLLELRNSQMNEPRPSSSSSSNQHQHPGMRPIVLSRKRTRGSGMDRQKLSELLTEALNITKDFEKNSTKDKFGEGNGDGSTMK